MVVVWLLGFFEGWWGVLRGFDFLGAFSLCLALGIILCWVGLFLVLLIFCIPF